MGDAAPTETDTKDETDDNTRRCVASFTADADGQLDVLLRKELPRHFPSKGMCKRAIKGRQVFVDEALAANGIDTQVMRGQHIESIRFILQRRIFFHTFLSLWLLLKRQAFILVV